MFADGPAGKLEAKGKCDVFRLGRASPSHVVRRSLWCAFKCSHLPHKFFVSTKLICLLYGCLQPLTTARGKIQWKIQINFQLIFHLNWVALAFWCALKLTFYDASKVDDSRNWRALHLTFSGFTMRKSNLENVFKCALSLAFKRNMLNSQTFMMFHATPNGSMNSHLGKAKNE